MSAIRVSPPPDGPIHGGRRVGVDEVVYSYNQVGQVEPLGCILSPNSLFRFHHTFLQLLLATWTTERSNLQTGLRGQLECGQSLR